jgi:light-regulated signal transduction histidine kinase (bacteriophytochrome)
LPAIGMLTLMPWLFTGGPAQEGFWWSIVYVVGVFLVTTRPWAIAWLSFYLFFTFVSVLFSQQGIIAIAYTIPELLNMLFVFLVTFIFVYLFTNVRDHYLQLANKRAEELTRTNAELTAANKEIEQFAYVTSHDLQEPLRTISNFVNLLEKKHLGGSDKETDQYINYVVTATSTMQNLIKDLLDLSRIGKNTSLAAIDCNMILQSTLTELDSSIEKSGAKVSFTPLPVITGNITEMKQLFRNLLSNAIKFQKKNVEPIITISAIEKDGEYHFSVKDNGIGIEEQFKERVFILFQRLHTVTEYPGTGIGLAICKKIVTLRNGRIWMDSKFGEGSTFYFTIPK